MDRNDGGPAFPVLCDKHGGGAQISMSTGWETGVSMRDYFAAKAMAAMIGTADAPCLGGLDHAEARTAQAAYHMADAMLAERAKERT